MPKLPGIPGIKDFKGHMFHTARWDYDYTGGSADNPALDKLADKRVAIIGTGATGDPGVPYLGRYAKQLYVFQRTPSSVDERANPPTDPEWVEVAEARLAEGAAGELPPAACEPSRRRRARTLICDFWTEINRNLAAKLSREGWPELTLEQFMARREEEDYRVMERLRRRVDSIVKDKATAEALKP